MEIVNPVSLARGAALIEFGFSEGGKKLRLGVPDLIGIVAAYISRGNSPADIERVLADHLHPNIGYSARRTLELFNDCRNRGLWDLGAGGDDIRFTDPVLAATYPEVNEEYRRYGEKLG